MKQCYICINEKPFDGSVFVTQIADWVNMFVANGLPYKYYQMYTVQNYFKKTWKAEQIKKIKSILPCFQGAFVSFPSHGLLAALNARIIYRNIKKEIKGFEQVVIFSRALNGFEIPYLRKLIPVPVKFVYDARGCSYEEHKYSILKNQQFDKKHFDLLSHINLVETLTVRKTDKVFAVSNVLIKYLSHNSGMPKEKFFLYPCLSDGSKFFYDKEIRTEIRKELGFETNHRVFLYAGGLKNAYHVSSETLVFMNEVAATDENARFLLLSKDMLGEEEIMLQYPNLHGKIVMSSVPNNEMYKYLNAADYGLLFRENVPMNNVASPSKFAEHVLCGLPTIISDGVGDYSELCEKEKLGIMIVGSKATESDLIKLKHISFDRDAIAQYGRDHLSKQSHIKAVVNEFEDL